MSLPISSLWIDGSPKPSTIGKTFDVINPASQIVVSRAVSASSQDAEAAILAADKAQPAWEALPRRARRAIFLKAAELIQSPEYSKRIIATIVEDTAARELYAQIEVIFTADALLNNAADATTLVGEVIPSESHPGGTVTVENRALGTVFAVAPFNAPLVLATRAIGTALICGNAVVLKSSEFTPRCSELLVEIFYKAGLPKGVLNLLHISSEDTPRIVADIIAHPCIRHFNFTGSERVGKILAAEAAKYLKPYVLELGGKAAAVVLNDANVEEAARGIIFGGMYHSGQICMSTERVIIQRDISTPLLEELIRLTKRLRAGTECDVLPPLANTSSAKRILSFLTDAESRGARLLAGDLSHKEAVLQPHLLLGVEPGWPIWDKETFGPVLGIKIVDTEEEAIDIANKTDFSLISAIWTRDIFKGNILARKIRAGHVVINGPTYAYEPALGMHGLGGSSGHGRFDIRNFTQRRAVVVAPPGVKLQLLGDF